MLDKTTALEIVVEHVNDRNDGLVIVVPEDRIIEKEYGWVFFYQSRQYVEAVKAGVEEVEIDGRITHVDSLALCGNGPIILMKETGKMYWLSSAHRSSDSIKEF